MIAVTAERRQRQETYNREHGIQPQSVRRALGGQLETEARARELERAVAETPGQYDAQTAISELEREMLAAAEALEFERAAALRDELRELRRGLEGEPPAPPASTPAAAAYPKLRKRARVK